MSSSVLLAPLGMRPTLALQERGVKQRCRKDTRIHACPNRSHPIFAEFGAAGCGGVTLSFRPSYEWLQVPRSLETRDSALPAQHSSRRFLCSSTCATESNNAAIAAALRANPAKRHMITSQLEHSSVLTYCMALEKQSQDSPQSTQRSQGTAPQSASVFSVPSVVDALRVPTA